MSCLMECLNAVYNGLLYVTNWPLAVLLLAGGLYFTLRTRLIQLQWKKRSVLQWKNRKRRAVFPLSAH